MNYPVEEAVVQLYQLAYRQTSMNKNYVFNPGDADEKLIINFKKLLFERYPQNSIGETFLKQYFEFQFSYWLTKDTRFGKGKIMLNWIIGKKAFERWKDRDKTKFNFFTKLNISETIGSLDLRLSGKQSTIFGETSVSEEIQKRRFLNKPEGLSWCLAMTTLFDPNSKHCKDCNYNQNCKKLLKINYPELHKSRTVNERSTE